MLTHGSAEQQARFLPSLARGEEAWVQLFSEPGSGSDLASQSTRAVRSGDEWIVTGQKVWSSGAFTADRGMLLARTTFSLERDGLGGDSVTGCATPRVAARTATWTA